MLNHMIVFRAAMVIRHDSSGYTASTRVVSEAPRDFISTPEQGVAFEMDEIGARQRMRTDPLKAERT